jgi:hypothetical protein
MLQQSAALSCAMLPQASPKDGRASQRRQSRNASVEAQERVISAGMTSDAARVMLEAMPTVEQLMPELEVDAIERIAAPDRAADE